MLAINYMFLKTREEAEVMCVRHILYFCEGAGIEYDESQWELVHLLVENGS